MGLKPNDKILPGIEEKLLMRNSWSALADGLSFIQYGVQAIAQDEFSKCFVPVPRTTLKSLFLKGLRIPKLFLGILVRYCLLFPARLGFLILSSGAFLSALPFVTLLKNNGLKALLFRLYCKVFLMTWGSRITYHGKKPKLQEPHIFVANHTSFIDFLVISAHMFPHATVAQKHAGIFGFFQNYVLNLNGSLFFERSQKSDRATIAKRMHEHVNEISKAPLLIFPEGTCVNNEYTVLFHKGAFELGAVVCPVAIKYDKRTADAYWHSRYQSFSMHLLYLMTRWSLKADVWYLTPRKIRPNQTAIEFADEVKAEISDIAKLKNLSWDGYWKNFALPKEKRDELLENPRERYEAVLLHRAEKSYANLKLTRRQSFSELKHSPARVESSLAFGSFFRNEDISSFETPPSTTIRNKVLVSLQEHSRQSGMMKLISAKVDDIIRIWKEAQNNKDWSHNNIRCEYVSWRMWYRHRQVLPRKRAKSTRPPGLNLNREAASTDNFADSFPLSARVYYPDETYLPELSSLDDFNSLRPHAMWKSR